MEMFNLGKKLIIAFSVAIVLLICIGAVSAGDVNSTDNNSPNILKASNNGNIATNMGNTNSNQLTANETYVTSNLVTSGNGNNSIKTLNETYATVNGEIFYEIPSETVVNISNSECCSFIIQEDGETVYAFRQDSPLNGYGLEINEQNWHGLKIIKQEIDTQVTYFFHSIITENGWVMGQGGSQYNSPSRSIEQIASEMVLSNTISPDALRRIKNILAPYGYGHFVIKAPDGRYGIAFANTYLTGTLQVGQYMVIPNYLEYHVKGNYKTYADNPVDAIIIVCSYDPSGENRRDLITYDYKPHSTANGNYYGVDVYATNDNGHNVGLKTSRIVTHFYYKGKYYSPSVIPENPGKLYVATHIFENQPLGNNINLISGDKSVLVNKEMKVEYKIVHITTEKTITFDLGSDVDFVGASVSHGSYNYNAQEHILYWHVPAISEAKQIIITAKPKFSKNYNIHCSISGMSEKNEFSYYATEYGANINANDVDKYKGGSQRLNVYLLDKYNKPLAGEKVTININGQNYNRAVKEEGYTSLAINLNPGEYDVNVVYNGKFGNVQTTAKVIVKTTLFGQDIEKYYKNDTQFFASFLDGNGNPLRNSKVEFNINGVFYTRTTDENGRAKLNINLQPNKYIITSINSATGEKHSNSITVKNVLFENKNIVKYYKNDTQYTIKVLDGKGNPLSGGTVVFNINGVFYTRTTNATGYAKLNINLAPGKYIITADYKGLKASNNIVVKPILEAKDLSMEYLDESKFKVKLLDGQGNPYAEQNITFNINGVFYNRTTDSDGIANLNIRLMPGEYIITSKYGNGATLSNKITISRLAKTQ